MSQKIQIRPATITDTQTLLRLLELLVSEEDDFDMDPEKAARGIHLMLSAPETRTILVALDHQEVVIGMVGGQLLTSSVEGAPVLLIEDFVVDTRHRGRGVGKQLLSAIRAWGAERGAVRCQLLADRDNVSAIGFYEKQGWKQSNLTYLFTRNE